MFYGKKRSYAAFSDVKHYTNIRNPLKEDEKIIHPENFNEQNIERYKYMVQEQQGKIQGLENKILSMNNEITLKTHELLHKADSERQMIGLKDEITNLQLERNALNQKYANEISSMKISFEQRAKEYEEIQRRNILVHNNEMTMLKNEADKIKYELEKAKETDTNQVKLLENKMQSIVRDNEMLVNKNKQTLDETKILRKNLEDMEIKNRNLQVSKDESIRSMQRIISGLEDRVRDLTSNLQGKSSMEIESTMQDVLNLNRQIEHLKEDLRREKDSKEELKRQREIENSKFTRSETTIRDLQNDVEKRKMEILSAQDNLNRVRNELNSAKNEIFRKDDAISKLERLNTENENRLRNFEFEINQMRTEKVNLERNLSSNSWSTTSEIKEMQNKINEYTEKIKNLEIEKNSLHQSYLNENRSVQSLQSIKMNLENEINSLKSLDMEKSRKYETQLQIKMSDFKNQSSSSTVMITELQNQLENVKKERDEAKLKINDLQRQIAVKDQDISRYISTINEQSMQLDSMKNEITLYKTKINEVENLMSQHMSTIVQSLIGLKDLHPGVNSFEFQNLIDNLNGEINRNNIKGVLITIPKIMEKLKLLLQENQNNGMVIAQQSTNLQEQLKIQVSQLTEQLKHAGSIQNEFNSRDTTFQQQIESFKIQEKQMQETIYNYAKQIESLQQQVYKLTQDNQELSQQILRAKQGVSENTENMAFLSKEFEQYKQENKILKQKIQDIVEVKGLQGIIKNKEKFFKPSLKFMMLLFGKAKTDIRSFDNPNIEAISPTMTYWLNLLNIQTKLRWGLFLVKDNGNKFVLRPNENAFVQGESGLQEAYNTMEEARKKAFRYKGFGSIELIFWEVHKRLLEILVSSSTSQEPNAVFDLDWIADFQNIYSRSTKNQQSSDQVIDLPTEMYKYLVLTNWNATPDFSIAGNRRLVKLIKKLPQGQAQFNMLIVVFEMIRDALSLRSILSVAGVGLRKKNEYYDELNYMYLANPQTNFESFLMLTKFHLFHYFSRLSFSGEIDFGPVKDLLHLTIESHNTDFVDPSLAQNNRNNIRKRFVMRKTKYLRKDKDAIDQQSQDFTTFNLPTDNVTGDIDNVDNIPEVQEVPLESVKNFIVKIDQTAGCVLGEDNDVFQASSDSMIKEEPNKLADIENILLHKKQKAIHNTLVQNALNKEQIVWKTQEFTKSIAEVNLLNILNALKPPVVELTITNGFGSNQLFEQNLVEGIGARR
jgi:predicted  nucleic acid-binding Zn-ribbon protein